jgi:hypothetical protein
VINGTYICTELEHIGIAHHLAEYGDPICKRKTVAYNAQARHAPLLIVAVKQYKK